MHVEMPKTLEAADGAMKKQEGIMTSMDANEDKIIGTIDEGEKLIADGNIFKDKMRDKIKSIEER